MNRVTTNCNSHVTRPGKVRLKITTPACIHDLARPLPFSRRRRRAKDGNDTSGAHLSASASTTTTEVPDMKRLIAFVALGVVAAAGQSGDEPAWPQFRGPQGSAVADTQKPP